MWPPKHLSRIRVENFRLCYLLLDALLLLMVCIVVVQPAGRRFVLLLFIYVLTNNYFGEKYQCAEPNEIRFDWELRHWCRTHSFLEFIFAMIRWWWWSIGGASSSGRIQIFNVHFECIFGQVYYEQAKVSLAVRWVCNICWSRHEVTINVQIIIFYMRVRWYSVLTIRLFICMSRMTARTHTHTSN